MKNINIKNNYVAKSPLGGFRGLLLYVALQVPLWGGLGGLLSSCGDWLDVVPDGVATLDMAFNSRQQALRYLKTCYSYMPKHGNPSSDPSIVGGDEMWTAVSGMGRMTYNGFYIAQGRQNATAPLLGCWGAMYQALRDCNILLNNVGDVPDLPDWERGQWIAEVKFLKAYYHYCLVQMYGPVPVIRENIPVSAEVYDVKVQREPVDDCFGYMIQLLDEALEGEALPPRVYDPQEELGRITRPIAMALKAKILITAASPLFNGNNDQATLCNRDGTPLFNTTEYNSAEWTDKWQKAATACKEAIDACHAAGMELFEYQNTGIRLTDTIARQLTLRLAFTQRWNSEIVWANTQSIATGGGRSGIQQMSQPKLDNQWRDSPNFGVYMAPPLKIANMFYTHNGVPLSEDKTRNINDIYKLKEATANDKFYVKTGNITVNMHFDREPRFYAWVGFDCGIWYGAGRLDEKSELYSLSCKFRDIDGKESPENGPYTGYSPKKHIHYTNTITSLSNYSSTPYPWPLIRLSDLYLLYAEAINEVEGPDGPGSNEMFKYIDMVRARAGLKGVKESWDRYANSPKYNNQAGMRNIIQQERMIELAFEGHRFWDIRRWKIAPELYRTPIEGWSMYQWETSNFYTPTVLFSQKFGIRDYFWPISNDDILKNRNLVQNIGW